MGRNIVPDPQSKLQVSDSQKKLLTAHRREVSRAMINRAMGTDKLWYLINGLYVRHDTKDGVKQYSIIDAIDIFTDTKDEPRLYWKDKKKALIGKNAELSEKITQLKLMSIDGKRYKTDVAPLWGLLAIINELRTPTSYDLINAIFKGVAGGIENATLRYRAANIESGSEWAANEVHQRMNEIAPISDSDLEWWQK